mmetsp:Transcript_482/g.680  ORF Transcript_482/g.680 Transcript_482/m.680 type:complete len:410 (+) Transcript_482:87-1316(+)|eukprot:CAMPEP_0175100698 /NCGR_PEP_ID=MMETSP0086_2-20121207/7286_1 /TAXON_ID=136419 /ORGANISM="Unknown Unknown, Strain D1" /LENGTH=409 /DNA_ID=CAMNT_0016374947 /DNA_START=87 /DNA_END=1316 /DNA_ORIENTATION=+
MMNIGGDQADASYRYKMPKLVTKIEGRGNGIKTVIVNMVDVAKALRVKPGYSTKFFGIELGAQSKFNAKTERAIVNGAFQANDLQKLLDKFIDNFVLCPRCKLPETKLKIRSNIKYDCAACGDNGILPTSHKLSGYIIKEKKESKDKDKDKTKKDKKKGKDKKKKKDEEQDDAEEEDAAEDEEEEDKEEKEVTKKADIKDEDVQWFTDASKEAVKQRKEKELKDMQGSNTDEKINSIDAILDNAKLDGKTESASTVLKIFLASNKRNVQEIMLELKRIQIARGLDEPQKIKVLLEALINTDDEKTIVAQYKSHVGILSHVTKSSQGGQVLLNCIEEQVGAIEPGLLKKTPSILQALYEADVLDEDAILQWADSPPESSWLVTKEVAEVVRKKAAPFVQWLKTADEEDSD